MRKNTVKGHKRYHWIVELLIIFAIAMLVFGVPFMFYSQGSQNDWEAILKMWKNLVLLIPVFLINRYVLLPLLFFKNRRLWYAGSVVLLLLVIAGASFLIHMNPDNRREMHDNRRPPKEFSVIDDARDIMNDHHRPPPDIHDRGTGPGFRPPNQPKPMPPYFNIVILSLLVIGIDTGVRMTIRWMQKDQEMLALEQENVRTKLANLQQQVSPHFFMNTLNNIHALIEIDAKEAQDAIIRLSKMMRYMLYETESGKTDLAKEIEFIQQYISLMKLRFTEKVKIKLEVPENIPSVEMPPFLCMTFIENAFKHGVTYTKESFINISLEAGSEYLHIFVENSIAAGETKTEGGLGIENTRKRLDLLYGSRYMLDIISGDEVFKVKLSVPL
ncbi:MAG: histidine kinase [Bacteroidota bacterium]